MLGAFDLASKRDDNLKGQSCSGRIFRNIKVSPVKFFLEPYHGNNGLCSVLKVLNLTMYVELRIIAEYKHSAMSLRLSSWEGKWESSR